MERGDPRSLERSLWLALYVSLLFTPLALLAFASQRGADRYDLFAVCMGFIAFAAIVLQLVIPSRAPQFTQVIGVPTLLRIHRGMGLVVFVLVALHVGIFAWHRSDDYLAWLWPLHEGAKAQAGWLAAVALLVLTVSSLWRSFLRISYERWRLLHLLMGSMLLVGAFGHVLLISWYSAVGPIRAMVVAGFVTGAIAVFYLRFGRPFAALANPYVVTGIRPERGGATTIQLESTGHEGVPFRPGQFAWIKLVGSPYALREHPFSFASSAAIPSRPSFTVKARGDFTSAVRTLEPGTPVLLDGPHGAYEPVLADGGFVLIAAGIGITPAMSFLRTHADSADTRSIQLIYGVRSWEDATFREELEQLQQRLPLEIVVVASAPTAGWAGYVGRIDEALLRTVLPADAALRNHFVCGPADMITSVLRALRSIGVRNDLVYADRFDV